MMKKIFLFLLVALALTNCKDSDDPEMSAMVKPTMVISEYENDHYEIVKDTSLVFYKENKIDYILNTHSKVTYEYSANQLITKNFREDDQVAWCYDKYLLDAQGRVEKKEFYLNVNSTYQGWEGPKIDSYNRGNYYYTYEYYADGTVKEQYLNGSEDNTSAYTIYKYDSHGNIATITNYQYADDQYLISRIDSMEYDNKSHYFKNVDLPIMPFLESMISNITSINTTRYSWSWDPENGISLGVPTYSIITNTYQYDNNGFPTSMQAEGNSHYKSMIFKY